MSASISITDSQVFAAVRSYILSLLPDVEVIQAQGNDVSMPKNGFIAMNNVSKTRLATNTRTYDRVNGKQITLAPTKYRMQLDFYGKTSGEWAEIVFATFRDHYGCDHFPKNIQPLFCEPPMQLPLIDGEDNYTQRWKMDVALQYNPQVSTPMQFFDNVNIALVECNSEFK